MSSLKMYSCKIAAILSFCLLGGGTVSCSQPESSVTSAPFISETSVASINVRRETKKDSLNPWSARKYLLFDFIENQDLDVVCMQEVKFGQYKDLIGVLNNYCSVGYISGRRDDETIPVLFKSTKFVCLDSCTFWLSDTPEKVGSKGWDAKYPRMATWVKLCDKISKKVFCVVNTHLDHLGPTARVKGMELIKSRMKDMALDCPIVLTGDLNCTSLSEPYKVGLEKEFSMNDSYEVAEERLGVSYSFHKFGELSEPRRIDFILVTPTLRVKSFNIPEEQIINGVYMSDHNPVIALIEL